MAAVSVEHDGTVVKKLIPALCCETSVFSTAYFKELSGLFVVGRGGGVFRFELLDIARK